MSLMSTPEGIETLKVIIGATPGRADLKEIVLKEIRLATNAAAAQVFCQDIALGEGDVEIDVGTAPDRIEKFRGGLAARNVLFTPGRGGIFRPGAVLLSHRVVPDAEMERSEMYQEVLRPHFYLMAVSLTRSGTLVKGLGVQRERSRGPFTETELRLVQQLAPALIQAEHDEQTGKLAALVSDAKAELFEAHHEPIVLVSDDGRILDINEAAESILRRPGSPLLERRGHVATRALAPGARALPQLIRAVACSGIAASTTLFRACARPLVVELRRVPVIHDPPRRGPSIVALYLKVQREPKREDAELGRGALRSEVSRRLPPRQLQVVTALVSSGKDRRVIAADLGISIHTLNTEIRTIFRRFGVHRRSELTDMLRRK